MDFCSLNKLFFENTPWVAKLLGRIIFMHDCVLSFDFLGTSTNRGTSKKANVYIAGISKC